MKLIYHEKELEVWYTDSNDKIAFPALILWDSVWRLYENMTGDQIIRNAIEMIDRNQFLEEALRKFDKEN